jgi:heme-degrading monooxygenase HmoA
LLDDFTLDAVIPGKEAIMAIKVLITRRFKNEFAHEAHYHNAEIRALATVQPGYVSGKTIIKIDDPNEMIIVSTWESKEEWDNWYKSAVREDYYKKLRLALETGEAISFYASAGKT